MAGDSYIILPRKVFKSSLWQNKSRRFTEREAIIDLFEMARFADGQVKTPDGKTLNLCRGDVYASVRFLANRWKWADKTVRKFISTTAFEQILTEKILQQNKILSLCGYGIGDLEQQKSTTAFTTAFTTASTTKLNKENKDIYVYDFEEIKNCFNRVCISLQKIKGFSEARKKAVNARLKEQKQTAQTYLNFLETLFQSIENSDFLTNRNGDNRNNWKASFDWIFAPTNFLKILEGNYTNGEKSKLVGAPTSPKNWKSLWYKYDPYNHPPKNWADCSDEAKRQIFELSKEVDYDR